MTDEAFARAARTYGDTIYRVAYHALNSPQDAEDVMQTVLLRLYEGKKEFENEEHMKHWLLRVAVNESRKVLRSFWRRTSVPLEEWRDAAVLEDPAKAEVLEAVMALESKYRVAIYLYYYEGLSVAETAAAMRANVSTVQTWLLRARARLRKELSQEEEREESVHVRPEIVP
ncbi:RNA polymerase sigma factor [Flintibacter muris]|uniref:RNA polymerase sigma factor n=1 Tax=Flintibacter muris TaxID=2941327 RepID=UPI00203CA496|nr:sigma-70 family RNA polymerase sigma factor [Flintibacter muris]